MYDDRCVEPRLLIVERDRLCAQVRSLLDRHAYGALMQLKDNLPEQAVPLVQHLACRSTYEVDEAVEIAKKADTIRAAEGLDLYPADHKEDPEYEDYLKISEYLLMLRLMQKTQQYTDLVIRLNPLVVRLQRAWLIQNGVPMEQMTEEDPVKDEVLVGEKMDPSLRKFLDQGYTYGLNDRSPLSITICNKIAAYLNEQESEIGLLFQDLGRLNSTIRNISAHTLTNTTEEWIREKAGCGSEELMQKLVTVLRKVFPRYFREELLDIYEAVNRKILEKL